VKPPRVGHPVRGSFIGKCVGWASQQHGFRRFFCHCFE
jgi:hypothetical protein